MGDCNTDNVLNTFFSNTFSNLSIAEYYNCDPLANNINNLVIKCINRVIKYRNHPRITAIGEVCKKHPRLSRSFLKANREDILMEILKLDTFKAC